MDVIKELKNANIEKKEENLEILERNLEILKNAQGGKIADFLDFYKIEQFQKDIRNYIIERTGNDLVIASYIWYKNNSDIFLSYDHTQHFTRLKIFVGEFVTDEANFGGKTKLLRNLAGKKDVEVTDEEKQVIAQAMSQMNYDIHENINDQWYNYCLQKIQEIEKEIKKTMNEITELKNK